MAEPISCSTIDHLNSTLDLNPSQVKSYEHPHATVYVGMT
jgi:hypothetical protein